MTAPATQVVYDENGKRLDERTPAFGFLLAFKVALFSSVVNWLLVFIPVGIAVHFARMPASVAFAMNAIAIIPLAGLLGHATESVASRFSDTVGALMNITFGNTVELIIFIIALVHNHIRIVQASLVGSILVNLLLILGMSFLLGGLRFREQVYNSTVTKISASLLALSVMSLLLPTAFHASFSSETRADDKVLKVSRGTSVIVLLVYVLYLIFQLKSHSYIYATLHEVDEATAVPGPAAQYFHHTDSEALVDSDSDAPQSKTPTRRVARLLRGGNAATERETARHHIPTTAGSETESPAPGSSVLVLATAVGTGSRSPEEPGDEAGKWSSSQEHIPKHGTPHPEPEARGKAGRRVTIQESKPSLEHERGAGEQSDFAAAPALEAQSGAPTVQSLTHTPNNHNHPTNPAHPPAHPSSLLPAITLLLLSTTLVALCAEFMVSSIDTLVATDAGLSEAFIGLVLLPLVGNAAEHATAVRVALKNKMDLAVGVAVGSSIQIALFVTPLVVILGWAMGRDMGLFFTLFETVCVFVSAFIVNFLVLDGRSNYLEGALLCAGYVIVAVAAFFYPDVEAANELGGAD
ncbi:Sodium/calcium exchanger protein-domain-containing protein [Staphylotrichum tortipilum]|uniref:Sodium/calcium exchanger protein-domain-containing protein n=1 Tax=Staphylotrichum tortipilum TaxID=2831512 RepID=A0AAN6MPW0_9PEZI|nr:Sodium/calcium exchanger protein-domain-containing protein [Staphylotrichum longicolle]